MSGWWRRNRCLLLMANDVLLISYLLLHVRWRVCVRDVARLILASVILKFRSWTGSGRLFVIGRLTLAIRRLALVARGRRFGRRLRRGVMILMRRRRSRSRCRSWRRSCTWACWFLAIMVSVRLRASALLRWSWIFLPDG